MAEKVDRLTRVNELLKRELAEAIERGLISTPGVLVSVTEVNASVDLRNATVYISIFGADSGVKHRIMRELNEQRLDFQHRLARSFNGFALDSVAIAQSLSQFVALGLKLGIDDNWPTINQLDSLINSVIVYRHGPKHLR